MHSQMGVATPLIEEPGILPHSKPNVVRLDNDNPFLWHVIDIFRNP